ncbi:hypothetical protein [Lactobacillus iners]|uniref:Uncharacterized protein n=1 Tax=Lactobacillus iners TaxID=147802 RepID=A0A6G7B9Q9_9LACO|nr:hypothetical protein [Lactobacillus iners]MCT7820216.1 hypothetical protein [Lactobacillus crispatus]EGY58157.1 hypothetical protein HMPREF1027_00364 [Lactobacillus iners]MBW8449828.1 hypothetical protein [Lactobacillus iners]MCT7678853.1 hypothetical protein [Lactobacillus iners]MCT7706714.1 hypothetical protein [Lactobacillus iners]
MKKKVSILEIVATKIVIALLVAGYYWMWSRSDWMPEYRQYSAYFGGFLFLILLAHYHRVHKYKKERFDELAIKTLRKCDAICLKVLTVLMVIVAYAGGILGHVNAMSTAMMGWLIIGSIIAIAMLRTMLFLILNSKGV